MDSRDSGTPEVKEVPANEVPAAEPVAAGAGPHAPSGAHPAGATAANVNARMDAATATIERSAAVASARNALTPLEGMGRQTVAWIGAALVFVGVWLPVKTYSVSAGPFAVSVSWSLWDLNLFWGLLVLLAAIVTAFAAWQHDYRLLWATGAAIAVAELANLIVSFSAPSIASARPSWGWLFLIVGLLAILAAAAMRPNPNEPRGDALAYVQHLTGGNHS